MYMLSRSMYIVLSPPFETRPAPDDTVSVTLSLVWRHALKIHPSPPKHPQEFAPRYATVQGYIAPVWTIPCLRLAFDSQLVFGSKKTLLAATGGSGVVPDSGVNTWSSMLAHSTPKHIGRN